MGDAYKETGAGSAMASLMKMTTRHWADGVKGHEALAAVKVAATVSTKAASYMMELANHAQKNAEELDKARRAVEKYIIGTDVDTISDADPFVRGSNTPSPQDYAVYPTPQGSLTNLGEGRKMFGRVGGGLSLVTVDFDLRSRR